MPEIPVHANLIAYLLCIIPFFFSFLHEILIWKGLHGGLRSNSSCWQAAYFMWHNHEQCMSVGEKRISAFIYEMAMQMVHQASQANGFQLCFTSTEQLELTSKEHAVNRYSGHQCLFQATDSDKQKHSPGHEAPTVCSCLGGNGVWTQQRMQQRLLLGRKYNTAPVRRRTTASQAPAQLASTWLWCVKHSGIPV